MAPKARQLLFIHQGALGDQLLTLPLIGRLKQDYQITYAARGLGLELMQQFIPMQCHSLDQSPKKLEATFQKTWDSCISVGRLSWLSIQTQEHHVLSTLVSHPEPIWSIWGKQIVGEDLSPFYIPTYKKSDPQLILAPGSGSTQKNWPFNNYIELSQNLAEHMRIMVLMGPTEIEQQLDRAWIEQGGKGTLLLCPNSQQLLECYEQSTHFIGNDSGPAHLASVFNLKGGSIFLNSNPDIWAPYGEHLAVFTNPSLQQIGQHLRGLT